MRSIYNLITCSLFLLLITSCGKELLDKEQHEKEIYLVGAYDRVWTTTVNYSQEQIETYFTISSSGTLALDEDVNVKIKINEELVDIYNRKYWTILNEDKYYQALEPELYSIPSINNIVIKHNEGFSVSVPVFIKTENLKIDESYVIPVEIESTTTYPVNESGRKMLVLLKLKNNYSGNYQMDGYLTEAGGNPRRIQKTKNVIPTGINTVRLFYGMNNDSDEMDEIKPKTLILNILDENVTGSTSVKKVSVKAWNEESLAVVDSGECTYHPESKKFYIKYTIGNTQYEENLIKEKEIQ